MSTRKYNIDMYESVEQLDCDRVRLKKSKYIMGDGVWNEETEMVK